MKLAEVFKTSTLMEAQLLVNHLNEQGVPATMNKSSAGMLGLPQLEPVKILVQEERLEAARKLVDAWQTDASKSEEQ